MVSAGPVSQGDRRCLAAGCSPRTRVTTDLLGAASAAMKADSAPEAGGPDLSRVVVWKGLDAWRSEVAAMHLDENGIVAEGSQVAVDPMPYRVDYRLEAPSDFITRRFTLETQGPGWWRRLDLRHDGHGNWSQKTAMRGRKASLGDPGGDMAEMQGALDCDFGLSPLTNLMPIRRSGLNEHPGAEDFLMVWVSTLISACSPRASATNTCAPRRMGRSSATSTAASSRALRPTSGSTPPGWFSTTRNSASGSKRNSTEPRGRSGS